MKVPNLITSFFALSFCTLTQLGAIERSFKVTLAVIDDEGRPVQGARATVTYENVKAPKGAKRFVSSSGITDRYGSVTLGGEMFLGRFAYGASKDRHYRTTGLVYRFSDKSDTRWEPWDPTIKVVLKRIKNLVPMYAKRVFARIPGDGTAVGYDLEKGDWVPPYGKGETRDLVFSSKGVKRGDFDFDWALTVTFSNPGDGVRRFDPGPAIRGSEFRSPYEAPLDGYSPEWTLTRTRRPDSAEKSTFKRDGAYFFRVRTVLDAQGNVVKAWYGKIYGDFFDMVYYLNPDGTRNVEFDPKRNLFKPANARDSAYWNLAP